MSQKEIAAAAAQTLRVIGQRLRELRQARGMTLQALAEQSGISASMLSMVERGQASPSLLSMSALAHCLESSIADLLANKSPKPVSILRRFSEAAPFSSADGVLRRVLCLDPDREVEITWNIYPPGIGNHPEGIEHDGFEYGLCLEGELTVIVDGITYILERGDTIHFHSRRRHRIFNRTDRETVALWFNLLDYKPAGTSG